MKVVIVRPMDFLEPFDERTHEAVLCAIADGMVVPTRRICPYGWLDKVEPAARAFAEKRGLPCLIGNAAVVDFLKGPSLQNIAAAAKATEVCS